MKSQHETMAMKALPATTAVALSANEGGFDIRLPNQPEELDKNGQNLLKSLVAEKAWRSR
ncbi:hypothetical protein [Bradyrhizobium sp. WSM1417]|uniref:hypothetical protein n=1 Tax=Bradyrhizobium sp. WSM1417 TaxID=754500 RepID=UPI0012EC4F44|nr:hypothetical protein [Bradyrhizobium sp. WSM1417]